MLFLIWYMLRNLREKIQWRYYFVVAWNAYVKFGITYLPVCVQRTGGRKGYTPRLRGTVEDLPVIGQAYHAGK